MNRPKSEGRQYEAVCDSCDFHESTPLELPHWVDLLDTSAQAHADNSKGHRVSIYTHSTYQLVRTVYYPKLETDKEKEAK